MLAWSGARVLATLGSLGREVFGEAGAMLPRSALVARLSDWMALSAEGVLPLLVAVMVVSVAASVIEVRPLLTLRPVRPDATRLSPARGMGRLLSRRGLASGGRALLLLSGMALVTGVVLVRHGRHLGLLPAVELGQGLSAALAVLTEALRWWLVGLAGLGVVDLLAARRALGGRLMMTHAEVERERREAEGDPVYRAERRKLHRQAARLDLATAVREATVIVFDGHERAAALAYHARLPAPRLLVNGRGYVAWRLVELARDADVPIAREARLPRELEEVEPGAYLPSDLYDAAVALFKRLLDGLEPSQAERLRAQLGLSSPTRSATPGTSVASRPLTR
jgi:flagellar biosynthetic protein FlhB